MNTAHHRPTSDAAPRAARTVVICPDSFKGSISAADAAAAIAAGWADERSEDRLMLLPQADGGEGTLDAVHAATPGAARRDAGIVIGPDGRGVRGAWVELPDGTAVTELAQPSGLPLMAALDPLGAHTIGLGQVIAAAIHSGCRRLVIGLGGSASTDGAAGALSALGFDLLDAEGRPLEPGGAALARLDRIDASRALPLPPDGVTLLTDVDAPLLGPRGAAAVFGPQKGATPHQVETLDAALTRFAEVLGGDHTRPGSGAAGGAGYGFAAAIGAVIEPGADRISALTGFDAALDSADIVITGEGRFDATSLTGKVVGRLIQKAETRGVRLGVIAGQVAAHPISDSGVRLPAWSLVDLAGSVVGAMSDPAGALREAGRRAARHL